MLIQKINANTNDNKRINFKSLKIKTIGINEGIYSAYINAAIKKARPKLEKLAQEVRITIQYFGNKTGDEAKLIIKCRDEFGSWNLLKRLKSFTTAPIRKLIPEKDLVVSNLDEIIISEAKQGKKELQEKNQKFFR